MPELGAATPGLQNWDTWGPLASSTNARGIDRPPFAVENQNYAVQQPEVEQGKSVAGCVRGLAFPLAVQSQIYGKTNEGHFKHRGNKRSGQDQQGIAGLFRTGRR